MEGVVRSKKERKSRSMMVMGDGEEGDRVFLVCWDEDR